MSEPIVFVGIGILIALIFFFSARLFARSRLGRRTIKSVAPKLLADIEADMAHIHGQIAMATRRLELSVEQMKSKTSTQLTEISRTTEAIARLKAEQAERTVSLGALEAKERAAAERLRTTEAEFAVRTSVLDDVDKKLLAQKAELKDVMTFLDARDKLAETDRRHSAAMESLLLDKAHAEKLLDQARAECNRLRHDLESMRKQVETTWATERVANALLRERINDVAGEVVRVAHALEGLNSPMDTMMAGKAAELEAALGPVANANDSAAAPAIDDSKGLLAHRIRSLQKRSARVASSGGS